MPDEATWSQDLRRLRAEVSSLVKTIPGQVSSVSLRAGEHAIEVTWATPPDAGARVAVTAEVPATLAAQDALGPAVGAPGPTIVDAQVREIVAPLVGTFYVAPEPGAKPFVRPGERVEAGQTVGIVEAMKLLNPVCAEWGGEVVDVLVGDAEPVEYGQGLVRIRADAP